MLRRAIQQISVIIFSILMIGVVVTAAYISSKESLVFPTEQEINEITNIGKNLSFKEKKAIIKSRSSAVQVMSADLTDGGISALSGTYLTYKDNYFILTASHGVYDLCAFTQIAVDEKLYECRAFVLRDPQSDYIVIQVDEIIERTPVQIPRDIPQRGEWVRDLATQNAIYYTGYPNNGGPYTFAGRILAYSAADAVFIDSYGWSGSSGAGVFSASGNLIGWIMALEVGETYLGRQVLENFIWVIPLFKVDWPAVRAFAD